MEVVARAHCLRIVDGQKDSDEETRRYQYDELKKLLKQYPKYKDINGIRNGMLMAQFPELTYEVPEIYMADEVLKVNLRRRNVNEYTLSLYRLPDNFNEDAMTGAEWRHEVKTNGRFVKSAKGKAQPGESPFKQYTDSQQFDIDEPGVYALTLDAKVPVSLKEAVRPDVRILRATRLMPIWMEMGDGVRVMVVDRKTGRPQSGVSVDVEWCPQNRSIKDTLRVHYTTDAQGVATIPYQEGYRGEYHLTKGNDRFHPACSFNSTMYRGANNVRRVDVVNTDRAIYRPGQTVHLAVTSFDVKDWDAQAEGERKLSVQMRDADNKQVMDSTFTRDEFGMAAFSDDIPQTAKPG